MSNPTFKSVSFPIPQNMVVSSSNPPINPTTITGSFLTRDLKVTYSDNTTESFLNAQVNWVITDWAINEDQNYSGKTIFTLNIPSSSGINNSCIYTFSKINYFVGPTLTMYFSNTTYNGACDAIISSATNQYGSVTIGVYNGIFISNAQYSFF